MRKLCAFALPCSGAIFGAVYLLPPGALVPAALICLCLCLIGLVLRGDRRLRAVLAALGLAAGFLWTAGYDLIFYAPARWLADTEGSFTATVTAFPAPVTSGYSLQAALHTGRGPDVTTLIYASQEAYGQLSPGDRITFPARLRLADTAYGEQTDTYRAKGIYLIANAQGEPVVEQGSFSPVHLPALAARALKDSVGRCFDPETAPLITALLTGDKSGLPGSLYSALQRTGLAHTVAVSGLHVSFLAGLVITLLGPYRRRSAAVGILLLCFFAAAAGASPSVIRAVILQIFLLLAPVLGREYDRATALSAGLLLLLLWRPYAAASVSLQLSFASVAGIYLVAGPLCQRLTARLPRGKSLPARAGRAAGRFCAAGLSTTAGALLFTTPLTAYYFGTLSLLAPLSNLLCLWAVSLAFLGGLFTALAGLVLLPLGQGLALLTRLPAVYLIHMAQWLSRFPFASVSLEEIYLPVWLLLVYAVAVICLLRPRSVRPALPLAACLCTLCVHPVRRSGVHRPVGGPGRPLPHRAGRGPGPECAPPLRRCLRPGGLRGHRAHRSGGRGRRRGTAPGNHPAGPAHPHPLPRRPRRRGAPALFPPHGGHPAAAPGHPGGRGTPGGDSHPGPGIGHPGGGGAGGPAGHPGRGGALGVRPPGGRHHQRGGTLPAVHRGGL